MTLLSPLLYRAPFVDLRTGLVVSPWSDWLEALLVRAGGSGAALSSTELAALLAALTARVAALEAAAATRHHLLGGPATAPTVVAVAQGAGVGATASVTGTDTSGTLTLTTVAGQPRRSHALLATLTFAQAYATAPTVLLSPANAAAWALATGDGPSVRVVQSAVTTTSFSLRVGTVRVPRAGETYAWNFVTVG